MEVFMFRMGKEEVDAVTRIIMDKALFRINSKYREVDQFEQEFAKHMGAQHCLCLSSGTGALIASLVALGIGPGDEVIVPGYTFMATAMAVLAAGAIPVLVEVDETLTMDMKDVESKISGNTRAVIPVHMMGFPCNMDPLLELKKKHGFYIIEDACQSDGGSYKGKHLGSIGDCGAFSFNYFKIIACGEGGAVITNDLKVFQRALIYHDVGANFWAYDQPITEPLFSGINMRSNEILGAILRVQLTRLDGIISDLRRVKNQMMAAAKDLPKIHPNPSNDGEGDCGVCLPVLLDSTEQAEQFEKAMGEPCHRPINTGKHVYSAWTPVLEKRGAYVTGMDPYFNPKNRDLRKDVTEKACPKTLDYLSRTVYIPMNCDWTDSEINQKIDLMINAAKQL
jgi:dTDP-4-amino-4,6-dideoxygalactose transaminase